MLEKLGNLSLLLWIVFHASLGWAQTQTETEEKNDEIAENLVIYGPDDQLLIAKKTESALKVSAPIAETPVSISVITGQRLRDFGAQTVQDTLAYTAGVHSGLFGVDSRGDWSTIRGVSPQTYVDGLKSFFGFYNNTRPSTYSLSRVDILKGPSSVLYGQGSTGGVINLVSKLPKSAPSYEVWGSFGSFDRKQGGVDFTGSLNRSGTLLYRIVSLIKDSDSQTDFVPDNARLLTPSLTWQPTERTRFTLLANLQENESGTSTQFLPWEGTILPSEQGVIDTGVFLSEPDFDRYDAEQKAYTLFVDQDINSQWRLKATARYSDSEADYRSMWPSFPPSLVEGRRALRTLYQSDAASESFTTDLRIQGNFDTGVVNHSLVTGFDYQDAETDNDFFYGYGQGGFIDVFTPEYGFEIPENLPVTDFPHTTTTQQGFYVSNQMKIADSWVVSMGLRQDNTESKAEHAAEGQKDDALTGRLGVMHLFENGLAPYVSYSESFSPVIGADAGGNLFKPQAGVQTELGLKYQPPSARALFTASLFDIEEKNRLTTDLENPFLSVQTGEVEIQGMELEGQWSNYQWSVLGSYTYTDSEVTRSNDGNQGARIASVPENLASSWIVYRPQALPGFNIGAGLRYLGSNWDGIDNLKTPSETLFDFQIGYAYRSLSFTLDVDNATDEQYLSTCLARGDCFYGQRRTIIGTIRYIF